MIPNHLITQLKSTLAQYPVIASAVLAIHQQGGRALLVGGAVRDLLLGLPVKDLDIEVHGISLENLERILQKYGPVSLIGKSFGVLRIHGIDIDWSLPRTDSAGRKPTVTIDPQMSMEDAFRRRDVTVNAMGIDLTTFALVDPFNGFADLQKGILRAPDAQRFVEDPLRFFRVMQFIGRFGMQPDAELNKLCATMNLHAISVERIEAEFEKLLLKSKQPSSGLRWLHAIGRLKEILPELYATIGVQQEPDWHPEGDVFEHSMQALDAAVDLPYEGDEKLIMLYGALCHDLGKVTHSQVIDGRITSYGHAQAGAPIAKRMLKRITGKKEVIRSVEKLVWHHMEPVAFVLQGAKAPAYKRLARALDPQLTLHHLADLALADCRGRNPQKHVPLTETIPELETFKQRAQEFQVYDQPEPPVLMGRDLLDVMKPGKQMGDLLAQAYAIQIQEGIKDKEELKRRVLNIPQSH